MFVFLCNEIFLDYVVWLKYKSEFLTVWWGVGDLWQYCSALDLVMDLSFEVVVSKQRVPAFGGMHMRYSLKCWGKIFDLANNGSIAGPEVSRVSYSRLKRAGDVY